MNLLRGLEKADVELTLLVNHFEGPYTGMVSNFVRVVELRKARLRKAVFAIGLALNRINPDVVVSNLWEVNLLVALARRLYRGRYRLVLCEHNSICRSRTSLARLAQRHIYPMADLVIGVSEGIARELRDIIGLPPKMVRAVGNPVIDPEIGELARLPLDDDAVDWFGSGDPMIIGAGRLVQQKRFDNLLRAVSILGDRIRFRVTILGDGPDRETLERLRDQLGLADRVRFLGFRPNPYRYLARAAVFVLSSDYEGLPTVLIEAAALGVPIVSTNCPHGPSEILRGGVAGLLVPPNHPHALASAIEKSLTRDQQATQRIVQLALDSVSSYRVEVVSEQYLDILRELTGRRV